MDDRFSRRVSATCVDRVPLINVITPHNNQRIQCAEGKFWRCCEGHKKDTITAQDRKTYDEAVATGLNTARCPTRRVSLWAYVCSTSPVCEFQSVNVVHDNSRIVLVTSQPLPPVGHMGHVISHMTNVHGDTAFNALRATAKREHACIEVMPGNIKVCLSRVSRAYNSDPLGTLISIAVPRKHGQRHLWFRYLKDYTLLKSETSHSSPNSETKFCTWTSVKWMTATPVASALTV